LAIRIEEQDGHRKEGAFLSRADEYYTTAGSARGKRRQARAFRLSCGLCAFGAGAGEMARMPGLGGSRRDLVLVCVCAADERHRWFSRHAHAWLEHDRFNRAGISNLAPAPSREWWEFAAFAG
jgi:hypothetical protein